MSTAIYEIGADFGNWGAKAVRYKHDSNDVETTTIRNTVLPYDRNNANLHNLPLFGGSLEEKAARKGTLDSDSVRFQVGDQDYIVGEAAYRLGAKYDAAIGFARYQTADFSALVAATFLQLYSKRSGAIALTFSLPVEAFRHDIHLEVTEMLVDGPWSLEYNGKPLNYEVIADMINVIPEGFGSLCYLCLSESGKRFKDRELAEGRVVVMDFGGYTFDITTYDCLDIGSVNSSHNSGLIHVRKHINSALKNRFRRTSDISDLMLDEVIRTRVYGQAGFDKEDVGDIVDDAFEPLISVARDKWTFDLENGYDYDTVAISGGGGPLIAPYLKPLLDHGNIIAIPAGEAHLANAVGSLRHRRFMRLTA